MNWSAPQIVVRAAEAACVAKASQLAQHASLTFDESIGPHESSMDSESNLWTLLVKPAELSLIRPDGLSIEIDFIRGKGIQRAREASFGSQPLARALGIKKFRKRCNQNPTIIDATAGLGTDGWMMASLGCAVRLLEVSPVLATMLEHALNEARCAADRSGTNSNPQKGEVNKPVQHRNPAYAVSVINTNAIHYLNNHENPGADIIYLDPMYPQTRSKALVKKGMQLLHELIGADSNGTDLLEVALKKAGYRVVVKRPRGAPELHSTTPFIGQKSTIQSPNTRYDIYHVDALS